MITRRCKSCRKLLSLNHFDLECYTAVCKACSKPWPGAALAMRRMYVAMERSIPRLARALGYTHATTETYLSGPSAMCLRTTHRIRVVYEDLRAERNGVVLLDSADELALRAQRREHMLRYRTRKRARDR